MRFYLTKRGLLIILASFLMNAFYICVLMFGLGSSYGFPNENKTVYTTSTGSYYHAASCESLYRSKHKTTLLAATEKGYQQCEYCDAPVLREKVDFNFDFVHYVITVPVCALFSYIGIKEGFSDDEKTPMYITHLALGLLCSLLAETIIKM